MANRKIMRGKLLTTAALAAVGFGAMYGRRAYAQACTPSGGVYNCAGFDNDEQLLTAPAIVNLGADLDIDSLGQGIAIAGPGAVTVRDTGGANAPRSIQAGAVGLFILHTGAGAITVDTGADIAGDGPGVAVLDNGSGAINITLDGEIFSNSDSGVLIDKMGDGDVSLTTGGEVAGYAGGVRIEHEGGGNVAFSNTGDIVSGYDYAGVSISSYSDAGGVTVNNSGRIAAIGGSGKYDPSVGVIVTMDNPDGVGDLAITNAEGGEIYGYLAGIAAYVAGEGDIRIENHGTVEAHFTPGSLAGAANAGGIMAVQTGGGDVVIDNTGDVSGFIAIGGVTEAPCGCSSAASGGDVTITSSGDLTGVVGVLANAKYGGDTTVDLTGGAIDADMGVIATGKYSDAVTVRAAEGSRIDSSLFGVLAVGSGDGDVSITIDGDITADGVLPYIPGSPIPPGVSLGTGVAAVSLTGDVTVDIGGSVTSDSKYGVVAASGGDASITIAEGARVATGATATGYYGPFGTPAALAVSDSGGKYATAGAAHVTVAGEVDGGANGAYAIILRGISDDTLELHGTYEITGQVDALTDPAGGTDTLTFGGEADGTFDISEATDGGQFQGFESFSKEGGSKWTLTGDNADITAFAVNSGDLRVNGNMSSAVFTVANGATIGGSGALGTLAVNGLIAPGNSIGTLNVASITLNPTALYEVEIAANGDSDLIAATGAATINGADLRVITLDPELDYIDGQTFTILTAAGGVTGAFDELLESSLFLDFTLNYAANEVSLVTEVIHIPVELAATVNQVNAALDLQAFGRARGSDSLAVFNSLLMLTTADDVRNAFDSASGEAHASLQTASLQSADLFQSTLARRSGSLSGSGAGVSERLMGGASVWGVVLGQGGEIAADGNAAELEHNLAGLAFGAEGGRAALGGTVTAGVAAGFDSGRGSIDGRASAAELDSWHVGGYAAWDNDALRVSSGVTYTQTQIESVRTIGWAGLAPRTAEAERDGDIFGASLEAAWRLPSGPAGFTLAPLVLVDYLSGAFDAAQETGAGALNATIHEKDFTRLEAGFGLEAAYDVDMGGRTFSVDGRVAYRNLLSGRSALQPISLEGAPGGVFGVYGPQQGDRVTLGLGVSSDVTDALSLSARIDASVSDNGDATRATIGGAWKF